MVVKSPKISVIILNYNGHADTLECIESIMHQSYENIDIIVVDNNSIKDISDYIEKKYINIHFLKQKENLGFSAGNNAGVRYALKMGTDYVMFLNNDTVIDKDFFSNILLHANPDTVVCPKIVFYDQPQTLWYAGGEFQKHCGHAISYGYGRKDCGKYNISGYTGFATGCCLLLHRNIIEKVGMWDEQFFLYREDDEYSERILRKGFNIYYEASAKLYHKEGRSSGNSGSKIKCYYWSRNSLYLIKKLGLKKSVLLKRYFLTFAQYITSFLNQDNHRVNLYAIIDFQKGRMGKCTWRNLNDI